MNFQRRYLRLLSIGSSLPDSGRPLEIPFPVDSEVLGFSSQDLEFVFSAPALNSDPRAMSSVSRLVWAVKAGDEIPHGAQVGNMVAVVSHGPGKFVVFVETEKQALARLAATRR